jgi:phosphoglycerate kinase
LAKTRRFRTLDELDVGGRRVLLRVDLNVPVDDDHMVTDDTRIQRLVPTLTELAERGARTILMSHFGRPKGRRNEEMSLRFLAMPLSQVLDGADIAVVGDCVGAGAEAAVASLRPGAYALLENLRFHPGEEANDDAFADKLARLGDVYVNDAFSVSHRAHASVVGLPARLPHAAGRLMQEELDALEKALGDPERPVMAIVGGAKVSTKLALLGNLIEKVDILAIGGGMANTFLNAQGVDVGRSLHEADMAREALAILSKADSAACEIILPVDAAVRAAPDSTDPPRTVMIDSVPTDAMILDIGPDTTDLIDNRIPDCRTVIWNGPVGLFETPPFDTATVMLARTTAAMTRSGALISVAGGGDTVAALVHAGAEAGFSYVSTAGGAFLEWLEGRPLPGVVALEG